MTPFECYVDYLALKRHFSVDNYDFKKYNGKVNVKYDAFERRKDRYYFERLSKKRHPHHILFANIQDDPSVWIGDLSEEKFTDWKKAVSALEYTFGEDVKKLDPDFDRNFRVEDGGHPPALKLYLRGEIRKETLVILNQLLGFAGHWNRKIEDTVVWPQLFFNMKKYSSFLTVDLDKYRDLLKKNVDAI